MKLNKLCESKKLDDMLLWGANNIYDFLDLKHQGVIDLDEKSGTINAFSMVISTRVEEFPYIIEAENKLEIIAPNLKSFKNLNRIDVPYILFTNQSKLNFYDLDSTGINGNNVRLTFGFDNYNTLEARMFTEHDFKWLSFSNCPSSTLYDFSQYTNNAGIDRLSFREIVISDFKNITYLLDDSVFIYEVLFNFMGGVALEKIVNKYLIKQNKFEHVMDFTVELIDAEFNESIL